MKRSINLVWGLLVSLSLILTSPVFASPLRLTNTDEMIIALRQAVQKEYQVPAHDVLVIWNDELLETKLKKFGANTLVEIDEQEFKRLVNKTVLVLKVIQNGEYRSRLNIKVRVDGWSEALRTLRPIQKGEPFTQENMKKVREKLSVLPQDFVRRLPNLDEYKASRNLKADEILVQTALQARPLVFKGNPVRVKVVNDVLTLFAEGEALEEGARGDMIQVKILNFGSKKLVKAQVTGSGEVTLVIK